MAHTWTGHVRELESLLLVAVSESDAHFVALTRGVRERVQTVRREPPTAAAVEAALTEAGGNVSRAFRALGLPSRDSLNRLIKKHGIVVKR
jgi:transcriptional regulator of acetoin/glycerol metabolism